jgi:3-oxoadipate enol-lactonase
MPFAHVNGVHLYYELHGSGPRLLYLGSTGADLRNGSPVLNSPLAASYQVLTYDQRGQGQTETSDTPYTMADYAADADALLADQDWERCLVVGQSFGGMVAQELAIRYPNRVERMVLINTSSGGAGGSSFPLHELASLSPEDRTRRQMTVMDVRRDAAWQEANSDQVKTMIEQAVAREAAGANDPARQLGTQRQLAARAGHDTYDRLSSIQTPTLICGSRYDGNAKPEGVEVMATQIPDARLEWFDTGHLFHLGPPGPWETIAAFLKG